MSPKGAELHSAGMLGEGKMRQIASSNMTSSSCNWILNLGSRVKRGVRNWLWHFAAAFRAMFSPQKHQLHKHEINGGVMSSARRYDCPKGYHVYLCLPGPQCGKWTFFILLQIDAVWWRQTEKYTLCGWRRHWHWVLSHAWCRLSKSGPPWHSTANHRINHEP